MKRVSITLALFVAACGSFKMGSICLPSDTSQNSTVGPAEVVPPSGTANSGGSGSSENAGNSGTGSETGSGTGAGTGSGTGTGSNPPSFMIAAATSQTKPWNTKAAPAVFKVGDTVTFKNNDSVTHIMHGGGSCPFDHWPVNAPLQPGASVSFKVLRAYDPNSATTSPCYEHDGMSNQTNSTAPIWIKSLP
ncbi:MAG: hypothetical protein HYR96_07815 [Deltaproteobacteria bacterium]|nr:hypothetical protein [Deltaproteobacteria bacterium]MBI3294499.1 hypothetical protein [Deltaproteobacteria bacterium]